MFGTPGQSSHCSACRLFFGELTPKTCKEETEQSSLPMRDPHPPNLARLLLLMNETTSDLAGTLTELHRCCPPSSPVSALPSPSFSHSTIRPVLHPLHVLNWLHCSVFLHSSSPWFCLWFSSAQDALSFSSADSYQSIRFHVR